MQADAGFVNHVQAGRLLTQAGPPLAQAFRMEAGPLRNTQWNQTKHKLQSMAHERFKLRPCTSARCINSFVPV